MPDDVLARLPGNGGVCMVTFVPRFVSPAVREWALEVHAAAAAAGIDTRDLEAMATFTRLYPASPPEATMADVVAHCEHVREVAGIDHLGLGGDFDGVPPCRTACRTCRATRGCSMRSGSRSWSDDDLAKLANGNISRILHAAEDVAVEQRSLRGPSLATWRTRHSTADEVRL